MADPIRIMSMPVDDGGCGWYRVRQPFNMIQQHTPHDTYIIDANKDNMEDVVKAMRLTHVMVMRPGSEASFWSMKDEPEFRHLKWVMDIDDNVEQISPYSIHYAEYGLEDYFDKNLNNWLWKDGEKDFDVKRNLKRIGDHVGFYQHADLITVTTEKLADYARQYNPNVAVLPNSINFDVWWDLPFKKNKQLRVGWSGGASHYEDWYSIKEPLNDLMRELQFTLVVAGHNFKGIVDEDNRHLVETHDWVPFKGHSYRMMCMNLDLAIVPLADLPFNHYKSPIKLLEFAAMGVPTIAAYVTPYKEIIDRSDAFTGYTTPNNFRKAVLEALQNVHQSKQLGKKAQKWTKEHYNAKNTAQAWINAYQKLLETGK